MDASVEGPIRDVETLDGVHEGCDGEPSRRKPAAVPPPADVVSHPTGVDTEGKHALWTNRRADFPVVHECRGATEFAVLSNPRGIEHHDSAAGLALHAAAFGLPPALLVGQFAQGLDEIEFDDLPLIAIDVIRRLGPAERAAQLLGCRMPLRLGATRRALVLFECGDHLMPKKSRSGVPAFSSLKPGKW